MPRRAKRSRGGIVPSAPALRHQAHSPLSEVIASRPRISRGIVFAALVAVCLLVAVGYISWAATRSQSPLAAAAPSASRGTAASAGEATELGDVPHLTFQNVVRDADYAMVALVPLDDPTAPRAVTTLKCERVYEAAGRGLCLIPEGGLITRHWAILFDSHFEERSRIELAGSPSRARVSADGRYGATTVFVFGHSYADAAFSTQTTIIDMATSTTIAHMEQFDVYRDGTQIFSPDFNFWGVTFASDSNVFYATLRTGGMTYLVTGDVNAREVRVLHDNVECPSLSPDGTRIAFKKVVGDRGEWRFTVLDLATMVETPLAETESVDDQLEWLDDQQLIYGKSGNLWTVQSDGGGSPRLFLADALSPAVVR